MARVLVRLRLDVHSAVVITLDETAVNTWWVAAPPSDLPASLGAAQRSWTGSSRAGIGPMPAVLELPPSPPPRTTEDVPVVTLLPGASREATVVQVDARNRPSLLADVAEVITVHRLQVRSAHVMTLGQRAVDVLYLTDQHGRSWIPPSVGRVVAALMDAAAT